MPKNNGRNPSNPQSELFKALTRIFSGPIINYRSQSGRRIRRQHLDKYSSRFKTASGQQFKKSLYNPLDSISTNAIANQRRVERYIDFDQMEYMPEIASSLDIYADEMTTYSDLRPMLNIRCPNEEIKAVLTILFDQVLNVQYNLFGWSRTMWTFENWQVAHFRILGNDKYMPYGSSVLEPARRIWRQLTLMEDAMMAYRVVRSSERRVFKIDVGAIPPQDVEQYMEKIVTQLKRHSVINPDTGRVDLRYNPMSIEEDYFIPVRAGSVTEIQSLAGAQNITAIDDIKYLRDKLFSALKVPQSYLTMGEGATEDKTTLAAKDVRFARTIQRLQRVIIAELTKIGIIHLYTLGFRGDDLLGFDLNLNNPSKIAELQELEHWKTKFDIAASATEGYFSRRWVCENIFGMSHEEFVRNQREMYYDRNHDAQLQQVAEEAAAAAGLGGDLDLGDDLGGDLGGGDLDLGGPEEMEAAAAGGEAAAALGGGDTGGGGGDESPLLAVPPGSRNAPRLTPGAKGKVYFPKKVDRRNAGARTRHFDSLRAAEKSSNTTRNVFPGAEINTLAKPTSISSGIYAENETIYSQADREEERKLFEINDSLRGLLSDLEQKEKLLTEQNHED
jgi:hypothetical protein